MKPQEKENLKQIYINLEPDAHPEDRAAEFDALDDDQVFAFKIWHFGQVIPSVKELREKGHKVIVNHSRAVLVHNPDKKKYEKEIILTKDFFKNGGSAQDFLATGGATDVYVTINGREFFGHAECSKKEAFCYKTGLYIALNAAIGKLFIDLPF